MSVSDEISEEQIKKIIRDSLGFKAQKNEGTPKLNEAYVN